MRDRIALGLSVPATARGTVERHQDLIGPVQVTLRRQAGSAPSSLGELLLGLDHLAVVAVTPPGRRGPAPFPPRAPVRTLGP